MAKHDEDTGSPLAEALAAPLAAGSLEVALHAARAFHMRHPGDEDAKRVMEALELLQAQVWFSVADDEGGDARYGVAAQHLEALDLPGALARYEEIADHEGEGSRASGLALNVRVVMSAAAGAALPARGAPVEAQGEAIAPNPVFQETTRIAGDGELPLSVFDTDEPTSNVKAVLTKDAYPDEPTRTLNLGDFQVFEEVAPEDDGHPALYGDDDEGEMSTGILDARKAARLVEESKKNPPPLKDKPAVKDAKGRAIPPAPKSETREVTRIAGANELPLDEVRRLIEGEQSDKDLDALIGGIDDAPAPAPEPSVSIEIESMSSYRGEPQKPPPEKSIAIDLSDLPDFGAMEEEERTFAPPPPKPKPPPPKPKPPPEPSMAIDISELPDFDAEALEAEVKKVERQQMFQSFEPSLAIDITVLPDFEAEAKTPPGVPIGELEEPEVLVPPTAPIEALDVTRPMPAATAQALEAEEALPLTAPMPAAQITAPMPAVPKPGPVVPKPPSLVVPKPPVVPRPATGSSPPPPMVAAVAPPVVPAPEIYTPPPLDPEIFTPPPFEDEDEPFDERTTAAPTMFGVVHEDVAEEVTAPHVAVVPQAEAPVILVPPPPAVVVPPPPAFATPPPAVVVQPPPKSTPPPPAPLPAMTADPIHEPLDTGEIALPIEWPIEPGDEPDAGDGQRVEVGVPESSWAGVRVYGGRAAVFEPGAESVEDDTWGDPEPSKMPGEREAEVLVARGELGEALRVYQDLAAQHPEQAHLWDRVAQIARMLQQRSGG